MEQLSSTLSIRIAFADDHPTFRYGLISLLKYLEKGIGLEMVIEADNGRDLILQIETSEEKPEVCVIDIHMPGMNGYDTLEELKFRWPEIGVLVMTSYTSPENISRMFRLGANGFLTKSNHPAEFIRAIRSICNSGLYLTDDTRPYYINSRKTPHVCLSPREALFLEYCCSDLTYDEIARKMRTSPGSIYGCRNRLFDKLNVSSRAGLVFYAIRSGLVSLA